jgi:Helix-turn-helix domain
MPVSALIVVESPLGVLALTPEQVRAALAAAAELRASITPPATPVTPPDASETLLTPEQAAELTGTKPSWWREAARKGRVPCMKIGRYPRFRAVDVRALGQGAA